MTESARKQSQSLTDHLTDSFNYDPLHLPSTVYCVVFTGKSLPFACDFSDCDFASSLNDGVKCCLSFLFNVFSPVKIPYSMFTIYLLLPIYRFCAQIACVN